MRNPRSEVKQKAMKRQGAFSETNGSTKPLPLMQQQDFGTNYYAGRASSLSAEGAPLRKSAKVEWLWQLERETTSPALSQIPCPDEVLGRQNGANGNRSYNPFQPSVLLHHLKEEEEASKDQEPNPPLQSHHELDMEIGYEDNLPMSTLESIDHNFSDELKQLDKQQKDAEDAEHTRHLERIIEISKEYREKRLSLRAQQVEQRRQFLDREAEEQMQHYHYKQQQLPAMTMPRSSPLHPIAGSIMGFHPDQDAKERAYYSYHPPSSSAMTPLHPHPHPHHHRPHHDSGVNELLHRDGYPQQLPVSRTEPQTKVMEGRVPLPAGRVYNNTTAAAGRYH